MNFLLNFHVSCQMLSSKCLSIQYIKCLDQVCHQACHCIIYLGSCISLVYIIELNDDNVTIMHVTKDGPSESCIKDCVKHVMYKVLNPVSYTWCVKYSCTIELCTLYYNQGKSLFQISRVNMNTVYQKIVLCNKKMHKFSVYHDLKCYINI